MTLQRMQFVPPPRKSRIVRVGSPRDGGDERTAPRLPLPDYRRHGKRLFDITGAVLFLLIAAPVILLAAAVVALDGGKPFFGQMRVGKDGRLFRCWKIRTMRIDADERLQNILATDRAAAIEWARDAKLQNDPRITSIGLSLRKSSIDELPQLWNVLKGDMSLVGPRPIPPEEACRYGDLLASYVAQRPGLTGLWQVEGRSRVTYAERVVMDHRYSENITLWQDLWLLVRTVGVVLRRTGY